MRLPSWQITDTIFSAPVIVFQQKRDEDEIEIYCYDTKFDWIREIGGSDISNLPSSRLYFMVTAEVLQKHRRKTS